MDYEIVYSAALERRGLGLTLSGFVGGSTLLAFGAEDSLHHSDVIDLYERAQKVKFPAPFKRRPQKSMWHTNRSKAAA